MHQLSLITRNNDSNKQCYSSVEHSSQSSVPLWLAGARWSFARSTAEFPAVKDPFQEVLCIHFAISSQVHTSCLLAEWIKRAERFFFRLAKMMSELTSQIEKYSRPGSFPFLTMLVAQCSAHKGYSLGRSLLASLLGKCIAPFLPSAS